jgi:hypothetical protein
MFRLVPKIDFQNSNFSFFGPKISELSSSSPFRRVAGLLFSQTVKVATWVTIVESRALAETVERDMHGSTAPGGMGR